MYKTEEENGKHSVFVNFPEVDTRVQPLRVNQVSYDLMQQIAAESEVDLTTQSAPITESSTGADEDIPEDIQGEIMQQLETAASSRDESQETSTEEAATW